MSVKNTGDHLIYTIDPGPPSRNLLFLETKLIKRIFTLGWPVILGMITQSAINTIDLLMIGRLDDVVAVPAVAAVMTSLIVLWAYGGFLSSISVGTQAVSARRFSEGNDLATGQALANSLMVSILSSIVIYLVAITFIDETIGWLTKSPEVEKIAIDYCKIRLLSLPSMAMMASFKSFYDAMGRVKIHMWVAIIMNIVNIIFDYWLIFGTNLWGLEIPAIGVNGAAWGSTISSYTGLLVIFLWSLKPKEVKRFKVFSLRNLDGNVAFAIAKLSFWSGVATVVLMSGVGLFNYIVSLVDAHTQAGSINSSANSIITHIMMLVFMSCLAFGTSTATLVSQSIGAKKPSLASRYVWQCVLLAIYITLTFGVLVFLFPKVILSVFLPADLNDSALKELVIQKATGPLRITALLLSPASAAGLVLTQALYGAGESKFIMLVEFFLHFFCLVPLAWLLAVHWDLGLLGCWLSAIIYGFALLGTTAYRFGRGYWKALKL